MQERDEILDELRMLSRIFDTIGRKSPYEAPDGYFLNLPDKILDRIRSQAGSGPSILHSSIPRSAPSQSFSVPDGYFDGLAAQILNRVRSANTNVPPAPGSDSRAELEALSPFLNGLERKMPYQVPDEYFAGLSAFAERIPASEEEPVSTILSGLRGASTYQVPEAYFESLPLLVGSRVALPASTPAKAKAKVVSIRFRNNGWKYAAAAVLTGFAFMLGWLRFHNANSGAIPDMANTLRKVSDQEILNYLDNHSVQIADADMSLNNNNSLDISDSDVKLLLGDIPDGDLKQYMDEHGGGTKDIATN